MNKVGLPKTAKERLSDKASDEQRVNDCKVPAECRTREINALPMGGRQLAVT